MNSIFQRIFKTALIFLFFIGGVFFAITSYFAEDIEKAVISKIQENIETPLILDDVEFTLYNNFPYASVKITNLLVQATAQFNNDTLLFAKRAYAEISMIDLVNKIYDVQSIIITDAVINIKYNHLKIPNFLIFKKNPNNKNPLSIKKITLLNSELNIKKETPLLNLKWDLNRSIILINDENYTFNTNGFSKSLIVNNTNYLNDKLFNFSAETEIKKDTIRILDSNLNIENILLSLKGTVFQGNILNLEIDGQEQEINQIITHLPLNIQKNWSSFIANGKITFQSSLKGLTNRENNPIFQMKYVINNGEFKLKSIPFILYNINTSGSINNGQSRNFTSTKIITDSFNAETKNGNINGVFTVTNLNDYFINATLKSIWDLTEVNQYFEDSPFIRLQGRLFASTNYKGNIAFDKSFKRKFLNAMHKSDIKLENANFKYKISPLKFAFTSLNCKLENHKLFVNSCQSTISETDFNFTGQIVNFIAYILEEAPKIYIDGDIKSTYTNFYELMSLGKITKKNNNKKPKKIIPNWINITTTIDVENFSYKNFIASSLNGLISCENQELSGLNLKAKSLNGEIDGTFTLSQSNEETLKLISDIKLTQINIRNSFDAFNNYGQKFITKEQIKGVGTAKLNIESHWDSNFILDRKKLTLKSHLIIEKGELIDFKPLENLSSYVSLDELRHVTFSTLENTIDVSNEIITIPTMEIKSSALSVFLSGTHTFDQKINYEMTLLLSELLSNSFRKENTKITEFGEETQDGKIFNTVYFKMTGNTNEPKISLNKIRFMEDVENSIKKEKETIQNIIEEDILRKDKNKEEVVDGEEVEIEWEPKL
ncbi:MAG: AsmA-like C-terminal region-containing protein [Bacteroidota bacterium]|nr:AsmA-like C-terminal region-containing protein [Bacteroidota bacterium]